MTTQVNKILAQFREFKSKAEFLEYIKSLYQDGNNLCHINYQLLIHGMLSMIDWQEYKKERIVVNPEFKAID